MVDHLPVGDIGQFGTILHAPFTKYKENKKWSIPGPLRWHHLFRVTLCLMIYYLELIS